MRQRNNTFLLAALIACLCCSALIAQTRPSGGAQQSTTAQPAQPPPGSDSTLEEELRPEELVAPSNASIALTPSMGTPASPTSAAPAPATSTTQSGTTVPPPGGKPAPEIQSQGKGFVLRTRVEEVVLHATVVDDKKRLVTDLDRGAFTVLEDGQPQQITSFRREDVPVAVGIVIDNSGSMRDKRRAVNKAALNFVRASNPQDQVFVVNFDTDAYLDSDFTSDISKLSEALDKIVSRGGTAVYDAVVASGDHLTKKAKLDKRVLLLITDGWDNASSRSLEEAVQSLQVENGPAIYAIGILDDEGKKKGRRALKELAEQTGGVAFFPHDLTEVDSVTQTVAHDIRNQYIIGYRKDPNKADGYRSIKVAARASGYKNLQVRTRSGYFPGEERAAK